MQKCLLGVLSALACALIGQANAAESATPSPTPTADAPVRIKRSEVISADNWTVSCSLADQANAKRRCTAELRIAETANGQQRIVFTWVLANREGKLTSVVSVPTGVLIANGVQAKFGDKDPKGYPYTLCAPDRCESVVVIDEAALKVLKSSGTAEFSITAASGNVVKFTAQTKGLDEAMGYISKP